LGLESPTPLARCSRKATQTFVPSTVRDFATSKLITGWQPLPVHAVAAYCVDDGLIASVQLYIDRDE
jgi:hypothetical protein